MFKLAYKTGETFVIGDDIHITVLKVKNNQIEISITAPKKVSAYKTSVQHHVNNHHRQTPPCLPKNRTSKKLDYSLQNTELTKREKQCLKLYLQGMIAKEIGNKLARSHRTIESHIRNIKEKLQARSRSEVFIKAKKMKLLENSVTSEMKHIQPTIKITGNQHETGSNIY
jgi:carbon storage regulator CsrA